jgi:hypothetical protein
MLKMAPYLLYNNRMFPSVTNLVIEAGALCATARISNATATRALENARARCLSANVSEESLGTVETCQAWDHEKNLAQAQLEFQSAEEKFRQAWALAKIPTDLISNLLAITERTEAEVTNLPTVHFVSVLCSFSPRFIHTLRFLSTKTPSNSFQSYLSFSFPCLSFFSCFRFQLLTIAIARIDHAVAKLQKVVVWQLHHYAKKLSNALKVYACWQARNGVCNSQDLPEHAPILARYWSSHPNSFMVLYLFTPLFFSDLGLSLVVTVWCLEFSVSALLCSALLSQGSRPEREVR